MGTKGAVRRSLLSLAGGTLLFLTLDVGGRLLSTYTESRALRSALNLPVGWPRDIYLYLFPNIHERSIAFFRYTFLSFMIVSNLLLYSLITYVLLRVLAAYRRPRVRYDPPPPPGTGGAKASR